LPAQSKSDEPRRRGASVALRRIEQPSTALVVAAARRIVAGVRSQQRQGHEASRRANVRRREQSRAAQWTPAAHPGAACRSRTRAPHAPAGNPPAPGWAAVPRARRAAEWGPALHGAACSAAESPRRVLPASSCTPCGALPNRIPRPAIYAGR